MKGRVFATYTGIIVLLNVVFFMIFLGFSYNYGNAVTPLVALQPAAVLSGHNLWTFITSMFMHASVTHLFVNMLSLIFIGGFVERLIGKKRYLWLYLGSGLFAGIFFVAVAYFTGIDINAYAVGASGAIFGLGGLLAVLTPKLPVLVFFIIPMPMWAAMVFLLAVLWLLSASLGLHIGNFAHLGGFMAGLVYGLYLKYKYPRKASMISRYFAK